MPYIHLILFALAMWCLSLLATGKILQVLKHKQVFDVPNARSNHKIPVPRGGGMAVILTLLIGGGILWWYHHTLPASFPAIIGMMVGLAAVSFVDDLKTIAAKWRFLAQIAMVIGGMSLLSTESLAFQGLLPFWLDRLIAGFCWLWFINLYNFMDGIDGITSAETIAIAIGLASIAWISPAFDVLYADIAILIIAAMAGFLVWNWHPAQIFLGDIGSVSLGFLLGWLLLQLAISGHWAAACILPAYYLADSGITLLKRILNKEKFWQAHSKHYYQQAVRKGMSPPRVVRAISVINLLLIMLAIASLAVQDGIDIVIFLVLACSVVLLLLCFLQRKGTYFAKA